MNEMYVYLILFTMAIMTKLNNGAVISSEILVSDEELNTKWNDFKKENSM